MAVNTTAASAQYVGVGPSTIAGKYSEQRIYDKDRAQIVMKDRKKYPMIPILIEKLQVQEVSDPVFYVWEDEDEDLQFTPSQASTGTNEQILYLSAANSRMFKPGDLICIGGVYINAAGDTGATTPTAGYHPEVVRVLSIGAESSNTHITVEREISSSSKNVTTSMTLIKIGSAMEDGWSAGSGYTIEGLSRTQNCQNFSKVFGVDENRANTRVYGPEDYDREMRKKRNSFNRELGYAAHLGVKKAGTGTNGKQRRRMGGMFEFVPSANFTRLNNTITIPYLNGRSEEWFARGSEEKWAFTGPTAATYIANKQIPFLRINDELGKKFGIPVMDLELTHGLLHIVTDWSFRGTPWVDCMAVYDLDYVKFAYQMGMDVTVRENVQNPGDHFEKHEIYGSLSLWRTFPESHHILYDITG